MAFHFLKKFFLRKTKHLRAKLILALVGALAMNFCFGALFYYFEKDIQDISFWDSVWWSMVTMTTVGYGDYYPHSFEGRFFVAYPCFLIGIGLIGYLLGMVAENMVEFTSRKQKGQLKSRMKNHIIICYCPSENKLVSIIQELKATEEYQDVPITVVDPDLEYRPASFTKFDIVFVKGDPKDEHVLMRAGLKRAEGVIILARVPGSTESDASSFAIGAVIEMVSEEHKRPIKTVAEVISTRSAKLFGRSKVDGTVIIEGISDKMMVQEFLHPGIGQTFDQLLTNTTGSQFYSCNTELDGRHFVEIQVAALQYDHDLQIIGLRRNGQEMLNPSKQISIEKGDQLIVLAENKYEFTRFQDSLMSQ